MTDAFEYKARHRIRQPGPATHGGPFFIRWRCDGI